MEAGVRVASQSHCIMGIGKIGMSRKRVDRALPRTRALLWSIHLVYFPSNTLVTQVFGSLFSVSCGRSQAVLSPHPGPHSLSSNLEWDQQAPWSPWSCCGSQQRCPFPGGCWVPASGLARPSPLWGFVAHHAHSQALHRQRREQLSPGPALPRAVHLHGHGGAMQQQGPPHPPQRHPQGRDGAVSTPLGTLQCPTCLQHPSPPCPTQGCLGEPLVNGSQQDGGRASTRGTGSSLDME